MTVLTPTQRQFIFTSSPAERFEQNRSFVDVLGTAIREGKRAPIRIVAALLPAFVIVNLLWLLGTGVSSVLLASNIRQVSDSIKRNEQTHDALEASKAEILSPDALRTYAAMIQLGNPTRVQYVTATQDQVALTDASHVLP